jgi:hypothetical protein
MKKQITDLYQDWKRGKLKPNVRQEAILNLWERFLEDQPSDFDILVNEIPNALSRLYEIADIKSK